MAINYRYKSIAQGARAASRLSGKAIAPFASINAAQWAIESAYGKAQSGKNNYFGIKASQAQIDAGQATKRLTHETINGQYVVKDLYFANYASVDECFAAHTALLTDPKMGWAYSQCWDAKTPDDYAHALKLHYATGIPGHPYDTTLIDTMKRDGLYELDLPGAPAFTAPAGQKAAGAVVAAGAAAAATHAAVTHVMASSTSLTPVFFGVIVGLVLVAAAIVFIKTRKA
jgi:hypothetical protein